MKRTGIEILASEKSMEQRERLRVGTARAKSDMAEKNDEAKTKITIQGIAGKLYGLDRQRRTTGVDKLN